MKELVPIARQMTTLNTGAEPDVNTPIVGRNAYRMILQAFQQEKDRHMELPPEEIGAKAGWRIAPVAGCYVAMGNRLKEVGVTEAVSKEVLTKMRILMRESQRHNTGLPRIEFDDPEELRSLYEQAKKA
jgi:hypothetical protein